MEINVELTEKAEQELLERARVEVRDELIGPAVEKFIKEHNSVSVREMVRMFGVYDKAEDLDNILVKDLTSNHKLILMLKWMMYDSLI